MKYLIHTYSKRVWYVEQYLIPSLLEQGVKNENISVYNDDKGEGNLRACMNAFLTVDDNEESTWHLQDDVIICRDFKERTENSNGLIAGFCSKMYDKILLKGSASIDNMWNSFPCICIPNKYARECSKWVDEYIIDNPVYETYWKGGKHDDWCFRMFIKACHKNEPCYNLAPNLVDHIDYLIGGGSGKIPRSEPCRSAYFKDQDLVKKLEKQLTDQKH